jgi:chromosome segregation ATPase
MKTDADKMQLIQRHGEISQLQQQLQGAQEQIETLQGDLQTRERELFHSNMRAEISEASKPVAKAQAELQSKIKMEKAKQDEETKKVADNLQSLESSINSTTGAST